MFEGDGGENSQQAWGENEAADTAEQSQSQVLQNQLAHELRAPRAQGDARGQLLTAKSEPGEREGSNVETANQQDKERAAPQKIEGLLDAGSEHVLKRFDHGVKSGVGQNFLGLGEALESFIVERIDLRLSLLQGCAGQLSQQ